MEEAKVQKKKTKEERRKKKKPQGDKITTEFLEGCPFGMHSQLVPYFRRDLRLF